MNKLKDTAIAKAFKTHWKDAFYWFAYNVIGGLLPVWGGLIMQIALSIQPKSYDFFSHGEFALYSAALCAGTLFTVWQDRKMRFGEYSRFFELLSFFVLILATLIYAVVFVAASQAQLLAQLNLNFLRNFTVGLYIGAVFISILAVLLDLYRVPPGPVDMKAEQLNDLNRSFDELEGKGGTKNE